MAEGGPLEEYKLAVELIRDENKLTWERFKLFFVINSALLAAIGYLKHDWPWWPLPIASLGIVMCIVWWAVSAKNAAYSEYWTQRARELEPPLKLELLSRKRWNKAREDIRYFKIPANKVILLVPLAFLVVWIVTGIACSIQLFSTWFSAACSSAAFCWSFLTLY